jgi:hypothetical protein
MIPTSKTWKVQTAMLILISPTSTTSPVSVKLMRVYNSRTTRGYRLGLRLFLQKIRIFQR